VTTSEREILETRLAAVLASHDVIEMEGEPCHGFGEAAILAAVARSFPDEIVETSLHDLTSGRRFGLFQRKASFRLEKLQDASDVEESVELSFLLLCQLAFVGLLRELPYAFHIYAREPQS
jgi:hypothetical protein